VPFSNQAEVFGDNEQVRHSLRNVRDNVKALGVDLDKATYCLGPKLEFDAAAGSALSTKEGLMGRRISDE